MKIEIGKSYAVSAQWKKSLCEIEQYKNEETGKMLNTEVLWRNGTFIIHIENEDEKEELERCMYIDDDTDPDIWDFESYENIEINDTFDGCSEDWVFYGSGDRAWAEGEGKAFEEQYHNDLEEEGNEYFGSYDWLEEKGYESLGCNYQIFNGVAVEEWEGYGE